MMFISLLNASKFWTRSHDDLNWRGHLASCQYFDFYEIPIHFNGSKSTPWKLIMSGDRCKSLINNDMFKHKLDGELLYPYRVQSFDAKNIRGIAKDSALIFTTINGADFHKSKFDGFTVYGTFASSDADVGEVRIRLARGDSLLFRSGPSPKGFSLKIIDQDQFSSDLPVAIDWTVLSFSNSLLPEAFEVVISDNGQNWGEWIAVALQKRIGK